jgi:UDP-N-acetylmuramoyl-tripeptide--D-alanyl-D-alanine ligase
MKPMKLKAFSELLGVAIDSEKLITGVCTDSRLINPGDLFFALSGDRVDGHTFLKDCAEKGAAAAVVLTSYSGPNFGLHLLRVEDVRDALQLSAKRLLEKYHPKKVIAITGSVGKTTTKEFVSTLLRERYSVASTKGNANSQVGLPLTIFQMEGQEEILVLEMGMTHPGQIANLVTIAPPDIAVLVFVALVHAVNFNSLDDISRAKAEIFSSPQTQLGIINQDICNFQEVSHKGSCLKQTFSITSPSADYYSEGSSEGSITLSCLGKEKHIFPWNIPGRHNEQNFLAAVAVARHLGLSWSEIKKGAEKLALPERRLQRIEKLGATFINDSYNASLASIKAALESLPKPLPGCKTIAVFGEMLELGQFSEACHSEVGEFALGHADQLFCLGEGCKPIEDVWNRENRPVERFLQRAELVVKLRKHVSPGDVILLKGSRAKELWKVLDEI